MNKKEQNNKIVLLLFVHVFSIEHLQSEFQIVASLQMKRFPML